MAKYYTVTINFGFIGADEDYTVWANSREEAEEVALEEAKEELTVVDVEEEE